MESRLFFRTVDVKTGGEIPADIMSGALDIRDQFEDRWNDWMPVNLPGGPEGVWAVCLDGTELVEYLHVKYPLQGPGGCHRPCRHHKR